MTQKNVLKIAAEDIKKNGSYVIPKDHPRCALTRSQAKSFKKEMSIANQLVRKGILEIEQDDREIRSFQMAGTFAAARKQESDQRKRDKIICSQCNQPLPKKSKKKTLK